MEISEAHARELEKQAQRKQALREQIEETLSDVETIIFEAGCGHGHWLTDYAGQTESVCVGIDLINWRIRKALAKKEKRGLQNVHFFKAELGEFLEVLPERIRFEMTVLLFPDPWPKARHHRRRMVQRDFLRQVAARSAPGARFCFRSDDLPYFDWTVEHLEDAPDWSIAEGAEWPYESETYFQQLMTDFHSVVALRQ